MLLCSSLCLFLFLSLSLLLHFKSTSNSRSSSGGGGNCVYMYTYPYFCFEFITFDKSSTNIHVSNKNSFVPINYDESNVYKNIKNRISAHRKIVESVFFFNRLGSYRTRSEKEKAAAKKQKKVVFFIFVVDYCYCYCCVIVVITGRNSEKSILHWIVGWAFLK